LSGAGCQTGYESGIHLRAKQIISERQTLMLPAWSGDLLDMPNPPVARDDSGQIHEGRKIDLPARQVTLSEVDLEVWLGAYKPDAFAKDDAGDLLIEIRVTHAVGSIKAERVQADGRRMIEIDLSGLERAVPHDPAAFEQAVLFELANRTWISCPEAVDDWHLAQQELGREIAERNRLLAAQRENAARAVAGRQQRETWQAKDKESRRAFVRKQLRAKHADDLVRLMELAAPARIARVLREYQVSAEARVSDLLNAVIPAVRSACLTHHQDAWIFGVDPALWQLLAFQHFVGKRHPGYRFNQRNVASWVRTTFAYEKPLYRLFVTQYAGRADARRAGFEKHRLNFWAFTDEENALIPDFYAPINRFVDRLAYAQLVQQLPGPIGECEVSSPTGSGLNPVAHVDAGRSQQFSSAGRLA
jgi:hypothetical protein